MTTLGWKIHALEALLAMRGICNPEIDCSIQSESTNRDGSEYVSSAQSWLREKSLDDDQDLFVAVVEWLDS